MQWEIEAIEVGSYGPVAENVNFFDGDATVTHWLPSLVFVLRSEAGMIVCDTSFSDPEKCTRIMKASPWGVDVVREKPLPKILADHGVDVDAVETVILSHHHWDHAGGTHYFKNAKVYIQKADWEFAMGDKNLQQEFLDELLAFKDQVVLVEGEDVSIPGVRMVLVGGHTSGSQLVFVDTPDGLACLGFDNIMCAANVEQNRPIGLAYSQDQAAAALKMAIDSGARCYCGHEMPADS